MQRVRLGVRGDLYKWLSYEVEVDPRAPEVKGLLRDAYLAFKFIPRHQLRFGQQKTQFGYENRESSSDLFAVNRTELSDALSRGVNLRDIGVGVIGNVRLGKGWRPRYPGFGREASAPQRAPRCDQRRGGRRCQGFQASHRKTSRRLVRTTCTGIRMKALRKALNSMRKGGGGLRSPLRREPRRRSRGRRPGLGASAVRTP